MTAETPILRGVSVAIVDDDPDTVELFSLVLESAGAVVYSATRPSAVLSCVAQWRPAVIVIDLSMPEMDGHELLREIRRMPAVADARALAMSGWSRESSREAALAAGFQDYVEKPVDPFEFVARVAACCRAQLRG